MVVSHCGYNFHFPDDWWYWAHFYCLFVICVFSLRKYLFIFFPILYWNICLLFTEFRSSLYLLGTSILSEKWFANMELSYLWVQRWRRAQFCLQELKVQWTGQDNKKESLKTSEASTETLAECHRSVENGASNFTWENLERFPRTHKLKALFGNVKSWVGGKHL